jgi:hypothetical protein
MAKKLSQAELHRLARLGAHARLEQIEAERRAILRAFPGLALVAAREGQAGPAAEKAGSAPKKKARKRRKMTAAEKKAVSERMKKFWAARKQ